MARKRRPNQQDLQKMMIHLTTNQYNLLAVYALSIGLKMSVAARQIIGDFLSSERPKDLFDRLFNGRGEER